MTPLSPLAERLVEAFSSYDAVALEPLLAPDVIHWVNITQQEQGRDRMLKQIGAEGRYIATAEFELREHAETGEGFVLQLVVSGETTVGAPFTVPVCLVVRVDGDRVVRIDEYASVDHAQPIIDAMVSGR
jgi:hypothetical protein